MKKKKKGGGGGGGGLLPISSLCESRYSGLYHDTGGAWSGQGVCHYTIVLSWLRRATVESRYKAARGCDHCSATIQSGSLRYDAQCARLGAGSRYKDLYCG